MSLGPNLRRPDPSSGEGRGSSQAAGARAGGERFPGRLLLTLAAHDFRPKGAR
jgi:hypothetical protein